MEEVEASLPGAAVADASGLQFVQDEVESLIGIKRKEPEAASEPAVPGVQDAPASQGVEPPAKKYKKKGGGKSKSGKKGSKKYNGRAAPPGVAGEQVEQRALMPASRDQMEILIEVLLSKTERAPQIQLSLDRLTASSTKGYRMVRATTGPYEGAWYFEIKVLHLGETGHTRLGWSTASGDLQAPVGYDKHGYAYRDIDGSKVHETLREPYGKGYSEGDVVGCYINLPGGGRPPRPELVEYKGKPHYMELPESPQEKLPGAQVAFFKNGVCQGVAYSDIYGGQYYPAASLYTSNKQTEGCKVQFRFGPDWECPPTDWGGLPEAQPVSKMAERDLEELKARQAEKANGNQSEQAVGSVEKMVNGTQDTQEVNGAKETDANGIAGAGVANGVADAKVEKADVTKGEEESKRQEQIKDAPDPQT